MLKSDSEKNKNVSGLLGTALCLAIMSGCIRSDQLMLNTQLGSSGLLKKSLDISFTVGKPVSKFRTIVSLDVFHMNAPAGIPLYQPFQEVGGRGGVISPTRRAAGSGGAYPGSASASFFLYCPACSVLLHHNFDGFHKAC